MMNPVILLHGALGATTQLEPFRNLITDGHQNVWSLDFGGHHGKPFPESGFGIETFAADVLSFMDEKKLETAHIFGYSMGGYVALWLAHLKPERIGKIITLGTKFDWDVASAEREVRKMDPEKILAKVPAFARILEARHRPNDWKELMRRTADMMSSLGSSPLLTIDILKTIKIPVLVCLGDRDDMADREFSQQVAGALPDGDFVLLENTTHPIEALDLHRFMEIWNSFMKSTD
jgi:pimeloyl-ACP methyl ester carboxylesterase